jgi:hypothetical protein
MSNSNSNIETQVETVAEKAIVPKQKKLKPARKQVKPGDVDKETAPQTGKEYSACSRRLFFIVLELTRRKTYGITSGLAVTERTITPSMYSLVRFGPCHLLIVSF